MLGGFILHSHADSFSLLDPNLRIIQKNCKIVDVDNIDNQGNKKANKIALQQFREEIRKKHLEDFNYCIRIENFIPPVEELNPLLINHALNSFKGYLLDQEDYSRFIYAENIDEDKVLIELDNRYCKSYQDKINRRAKYLSWRFRKSKSVLLTLTIDPSKYNYDKYLMWVDIKKQLNRFLTNVKYWLKKEKRRCPPYICSIEAQRNGNPHLHIAFLGASRLLDWRKIRDIWHLGYISINRDSDNRRIRNPVNYLMKYISKTYTDTNEKNELTQAFCWLFNIRSYQCSRGLISPLKSKSVSDFIAKYLIIVNDNVSLDLLYKNIDLIPKISNPFNRFFENKNFVGGKFEAC